MNEAEATAFTCVLQPIGDPSLRIEWLHNGHAVPCSNRIHMTNDFGVATLLIKHLITEDSGEYKYAFSFIWKMPVSDVLFQGNSSQFYLFIDLIFLHLQNVQNDLAFRSFALQIRIAL